MMVAPSGTFASSRLRVSLFRLSLRWLLWPPYRESRNRMTLLYRPAFVAGLLLAVVLAGCASSPTSSQPTSPPATAAPAPTSHLAPTAAPATAAPAPTSAPAPTNPPAPTAAPPAQPSPADPAGAVQTILNYYDAIAQRQPERAYGYWASNGAASGQTLEQFQQGFANTAGIDLQLGELLRRGRNVALPVTLAAVNNSPSGGDQQVQHFGGTYTMQPDAGSDTGWRIAAANIAESPSAPPTSPTDPNRAVQTLKDYYAAIGRHEYAHAYTLWSNLGAASNQSFAQFAQGFATTTGVAIATGTATGGGAVGLDLCGCADPDLLHHQRPGRADLLWHLHAAAHQRHAVRPVWLAHREGGGRAGRERRAGQRRGPAVAGPAGAGG